MFTRAHRVSGLLLMLATSANASQTVTLSSQVLLTADRVNEFYMKQEGSSQNRYELRRGKLGMDWQIHPQLSSEVELNIQKEYQQSAQYEWADVNLRYEFNNGLGMKLGRMKIPFSLESQTSSANHISIERSLLYDAFMASRANAAQLSHASKKQGWTLAAAYYDVPEDKQQGVTLRGTQQYRLSGRVLHAGFTLRFDALNDQLYQIKLDGEINSAHSIMRSARFYASEQSLVQTEIAMISGATFGYAQLVRSDIQQTGTDQTWQYGGLSLQLSHFISGGEYAYKKGKLSQTHVAGSWSVLARYSAIDLADHGVGSTASSLTLAVNHGFTSAVTLMAELKAAQISGNTINRFNTGHGASLALQWRL